MIITPHPTPDAICPALLLTAADPGWLTTLGPEQLTLLPWVFDLWLRPEQIIPTHAWGTCGLTGGRGFGKSLTVARWINARVMAGVETHVALMAPTEPRVEQVQIKALIEYAEPWQRPKPFGKLGLRWPNGVEAQGFTPEAPGRTRSENISLSWLTEIVDWRPGTREEAFGNIYTATRVGEARTIWDSTAKGRNEVRAKLEDWHKEDPHRHVILPGTMFDNPLLSTQYMRGQWLSYAGVRRDEELCGASFRESAGALWKQAHFDKTRVDAAPTLDWICVAIDPATSTHESADETGLMIGGRSRDGHAYATEDLSGMHSPGEWANLAIDHADPRKSGPRRGRIVLERKHLGDAASELVKSHAEARGLRVRVLSKDEPWPPFDRGWLFIREYNTNLSKGTRAEGPAAETELGRVHLVDPEYPDKPRFADLETECTTYVPGMTKRSPNRLDAFAYLILELRELKLDSAPDGAAAAAAALELSKRLAQAPRATSAAARVAQGYVVPGGRRLGL